MKYIVLLLLTGVLLLSAACGGQDASSPEPSAAPAPAPAMQVNEASAGKSARTGPAAAPAPMSTPLPAPALPSADASSAVSKAWATERMVIRSGALTLVVQDTARAIEQAVQLAGDLDGYVVSSRMWQEGKRVAGAITIRIPAELFPNAMSALKALAVEVTNEDASSQDVTEEYVDLSSQLRSLEATETQLLKIMETATKVEDVLEVQRELARVQKEIEQTKGRMQYLERSTATSLITVNMREVGLEIRIDTAVRKARVGGDVLFRASVAGGFPPFTYLWDLGDGTTSTEEAPEHAYGQVGKFDISLTITDDEGNSTTETKRQLISVEPMEVDFGISRPEVEVGAQIWFTSNISGGFHPLSYQWDMGDGTTSTERNPTHTYNKAGRYTATLTVSDDKGNTASETKKKIVTVTSPPGWSFLEVVKDAGGGLASVTQGVVSVAVWLLVLAPIWIPVLIAVYLAVRLGRWIQKKVKGGGS